MGLEPNRSPFGDTRLMKPVKTMLMNPKLNFFFADFYCITQGSYHYIVVATATEGSMENVFCERYLVPIDPYNNQFFSIQPNGTSARCNNNSWVFLFCMHEVKIDPSLSLRMINDQDQIRRANQKGEEHILQVDKIPGRRHIINGRSVPILRGRVLLNCRVCGLDKQNAEFTCKIHDAHNQRK